MPAPFDLKRLPPGTSLELYIHPDCPYCRQAMAHYERVGTPFVAHDAQHDGEARKAMFAYTGGDPTVPAIVVDGRYIQSGWGVPPQG